jgi:predicted DCC family thiol-disulfide oxidoreductase YuxK
MKIVFYDGDCGFCNKTVQFVLSKDSKKQLYFTALQSPFAIDFFSKNKFEKADLSTFYFWNGDKLFKKSSAAIQLVRQLKFPWPILQIGYLIPRYLRDKMYDFVANRRHKMSRGFCVLPSVEDRKRFL